MSTDALVINGLNAFYGESHILHDLSFTVKEGQVLGLLGRNGAGKTTCISAIVGLVRASAARLELFGQSIAGLSPEAISLKGVGLVPQGRRIFPSLTVHENLTVAARRGRSEKRPDWTLSDVYAVFPRLEERQRQLAGSLSGGEQQMLAIARALMSRPRLLLLDEPSLGLAPMLAQQIFRAIRELNTRDRLTVFLVEQNAFHALKLAHRGYVIVNGEITMSGTGRELLERPEVRAAYLEGGRREAAST